jgi:competence protein ComEC
LTSAAIPLGYASIFTGWTWLAALAGRLVAWSEQAAAWHLRFEPLWRIPDPPWWLVVCFIAALGTAAVCAMARSKWWVAPSAVLLAAVGVLVWHPFPPDVRAGLLEMTAIDVGNGDSLLLVGPGGKSMLVDTGGLPAYEGRATARLDIGEEVVTPYLLGRGIRKIDAVAISHAEADHMGGLAAVLVNFRPQEIWIGREGTGAAWDHVKQLAASLGVRVVRLRSGQSFAWDHTRIEVLSPTPETPARKANNDCLAMRLTYGSHSFLLTGDLEREGENRILTEGLLRKTDVLKIAHHGGRTSTTPLFLEQVRPSIAVISVAADNAFRHPHPDLLARLEGVPASVYRTDLLGSVSIFSDGKRFHTRAEEWTDPKPGIQPAF